MKDYLDQYRIFVQDELIPLESLLLDHQYDELESKISALRTQVKEMGLWAPYLPKEHGGMGMHLSLIHI